MQEQVNRAQQGKSSFEQFAQMLSMADGLDCSCSGNSQPFNGFPSSVSSGFGGGNGVNPYMLGGLLLLIMDYYLPVPTPIPGNFGNRFGGSGGYGGYGGTPGRFGPMAGGVGFPMRS